VDASDALGERNTAITNRDAALARLHARRERGQARPTLVRVILAGIGAVLFVASVPLTVVFPEAGVPVLLIGLRLLAVEVDWAARAYVWTDWRFCQARDWLYRQPRWVHVALGISFLVLGAAIVWWII
jgi:xanthine/uracil permease